MDDALPTVTDEETWRRELAALRAREKAATRELDAIAAQRRRLPMVALPDYTLEGADGPVRLVDLFDGARQLITYHHMWSPGAEWQCGGCTCYTSQFTRTEFLRPYDAPPGGGFAVNVFLRDGESVYRTWHTTGRGTEQLGHNFSLVDVLPYGRQEEWQDSPDGWPQSPTSAKWLDSPDVAAFYGPNA